MQIQIMRLYRWIGMSVMLVGLPPAGVLLRGGSLAPYFEFPPRSRFIEHAPFSWIAFGLIGLLVLASISPLLTALARHRFYRARPSYSRPFPWWGWGGLLCGLVAWVLAWTRMPWFSVMQPHTFPMLWGAFIVVVNGLTLRRTGACLMTANPVGFIVLFPASAGFWWFFEYLNRFVQNWLYTGADYPPLTYFLLATLSFATVLPAVLSVREWLWSFPGVQCMLRGQRLPTRFATARAARGYLVAAGLGMLLAGAAPDFGFPFLWLSPLMIILALQLMRGHCALIGEMCAGAWQRVAAAALAGLLCGFFWEMWNFYSLARWSYTVPFVDRFHLFEMPLLGYAGYLPFGLECALIGEAVLARFSPKKKPEGWGCDRPYKYPTC